MYFNAVHFLLPKMNEINHGQSGQALIVGDTAYAPMQCGIEPNIFHLNNAVKYPKDRTEYLKEFKQNKDCLGLIPCNQTLAEELAAMDMSPYLTVEARVPPVSDSITISLYCCPRTSNEGSTNAK